MVELSTADIQPTDQGSKGGYAFSFVFADRDSVVISADSKEERDEWIQKIGKLIEQKRKQRGMCVCVCVLCRSVVCFVCCVGLLRVCGGVCMYG
jgi:hypothetical protein